MSKRLAAIREKVERGRAYEATDALRLLKETANPKFDELFAAVNREVDGEARNQLYRELMQEERIHSGGALEAGPSAYIAENPAIFAFRSDLIDAGKYIPWTTPSARFENIVPA